MSLAPTVSRPRLATRLTFGVVVLLLLVQLIMLLFYAERVRERRAAQLEDAVAMGQNAGGVILAFVRDLERTVLAAALALGNQPGPLDQSTTGAYLHAISSEYQTLQSIFLTDLDGRVIASSTERGIGTDLSQRPYMRTLQGGAESTWSGGITGLETGEVTVAFGRAVRGPDGAPRAYLLAAFYPEQLFRRLPVGLPADASVALIDERGSVLYASDRPGLAVDQRDVLEAPGVRAALGGELVQVMDTATPFDGEERFGALVPVRPPGWVIAYTRPQAPLESVLLSGFIREAGAVALAMLVAVGLMALVTRRLTEPLASLGQTAAAIARGERPTVPAPESYAEVMQLAAGMRAMSAAVTEREDALREALAREQVARMEAEAAQRRLAFLDEASKILSTSLDYETTMSSVARLAVPTLADWCLVNLLEDGQLRQLAVAHVDPEREDLARELRRRYPPDREDHPIWRVLRSGSAELAPDVSEADLAERARDPAHLELLKAIGIRSHIVVPLAARDRVLGVMSFIYGDSGRRYDRADLLLAQELADRCGLAIDNARLYREVQEQMEAHVQLNAALRETAAARDMAVAELEQVLRTREEFLAGAAHDLKTPLTLIKGLAQMLRRRIDRFGGADLDRFTEDLARIDATATKMTGLIDELLDIARLQLGRPLPLDQRPTDLVALARQVIAECRETGVGHDIQLETSVPELTGLWDVGRIERVLSNLLSNAVKYSPDGSRIDATITRDSGPRGEQWAVLVVRDRGIGIPTNELSLVFERFHRASNVASRVSGSGVGLAAARQIVEQHGGTIALDSQEGAGTTVTVRLPLIPVCDEEPVGSEARSVSS